MNTENINRASSAATGFIIASLIFIALAVVVKFAFAFRRLMPTATPRAPRRWPKSAPPRTNR